MEIGRIVEDVLRNNGIAENLICKVVSTKVLRDIEILELFGQLVKEYENNGYLNKGASKMAIEEIARRKFLAIDTIKGIVYHKHDAGI